MLQLTSFHAIHVASIDSKIANHLNAPLSLSLATSQCRLKSDWQQQQQYSEGFPEKKEKIKRAPNSDSLSFVHVFFRYCESENNTSHNNNPQIRNKTNQKTAEWNNCPNRKPE